MCKKNKIYDVLKFNFRLVLFASNIIFSYILGSMSEGIKSDNMVYLSSHALNYLSNAMDNVYKANSSLIKIGVGLTALRCIQKKRHPNLNFDVFNAENKLIKKIGNNSNSTRLKKIQDSLLKYQANISNGGSQSNWFKGSCFAEVSTTVLIAKTIADNYSKGAQYEEGKEQQEKQNSDNVNNKEFDKDMFNDQITFDKVHGRLSKLGLSSFGEKVQHAHNDISKNKVNNESKEKAAGKESEKMQEKALQDAKSVRQIIKNQANRGLAGTVADFISRPPQAAFVGNLAADIHYALGNVEKNIQIDQAMENNNYNENFGIRKCPCSGHSYGSNTCMCKCDTKKNIKDVNLDDVVSKGHGVFLSYKLHSNDLT